MYSKTTLILVGLSLILAACSSPGQQSAATPEPIPTVIADTTIIAEGRLEPIHFAEIAFGTSGVVHEVLVKEGDAVKEGQALIRLGDETDSSFASAQLEFVNAQHALDDLMNSRNTDLANAVIKLKDAKEANDKAENYLDYLLKSKKVPQTDTQVFLIQTWKGYQYDYRIKNFKGPAPKDWIIEAENDLFLKKAKMEEVQRTYDQLKDGPNSAELPLLEARLNAAKAAVAAFTVTAPFDGVVAELKAKHGNSINAGETAVTIADFSGWIVKTTDVTEIDVVALRMDQPAIVTLDALPDIKLKGKIISIGQNYSESQGDIVYEVVILLTDKYKALRWGMTAAVKFE